MIQTEMNLDPCAKEMEAYRIARGGEKNSAYKKLVKARAKQLRKELRVASTRKAA
jgi:hypothetical protein